MRVVTLHSGQSSPGTPMLPCSITGTGPAEETTVRQSARELGSLYLLVFHVKWKGHKTPEHYRSLNVHFVTLKTSQSVS